MMWVDGSGENKNSPSQDLGRDVAVAHVAVYVHPAPFCGLEVRLAPGGAFVVGCEQRVYSQIRKQFRENIESTRMSRVHLGGPIAKLVVNGADGTHPG